jgi:hypothetical protein
MPIPAKESKRYQGPHLHIAHGVCGTLASTSRISGWTFAPAFPSRIGPRHFFPYAFHFLEFFANDEESFVNGSLSSPLACNGVRTRSAGASKSGEYGRLPESQKMIDFIASGISRIVI